MHLANERDPSLAIMLDANLVKRVLERYEPDVIFHLAAQSYVPKSVADPASTLTNNILWSGEFAGRCRRDWPESADSHRQLIGDLRSDRPEKLPVDEVAPLRPGNPYAVSKATQDLLGYQYATSASAGHHSCQAIQP